MKIPQFFQRWPTQLALTLLLALIVRLLGIASRPIWYDEAFTILFAQKGLAAMLAGTLSSAGAGGAAEEHPLAYYLLAWGWMQAFGNSLISARMLSVLAGLGIVALAYGVASSLWNPRVALAVALIIAISPFQVHYAQEIRMYAWMTLWLALATWFYIIGQTGPMRSWLFFGVVAALAQYTHTLAAIYLVCLAAWPLFTRHWQALRGVLIGGLIALVLYIPWLMNLPAQFSKVNTSYWTEPPGVERIFTTLLSYVSGLPVPETWLPAALGLTLLLLTLGFWQTIRAKNTITWWMFYLTFAPALLLFTVSQWIPIYVERALLPSGFTFCLWLAAAFWHKPSPQTLRWLAGASIAGSALIGLGVHLSYSDFPYLPAQQITALLQTNRQPGDVIIHSNKLTALPAIYADPTLPHRYVADPPGESTDTLALATQQTLGWLASPDIEAAAQDAPRLWLIIFRQSEQEAQAQGLATHPHITWAQAHYHLQETHTLDGVVVYLYSK